MVFIYLQLQTQYTPCSQWIYPSTNWWWNRFRQALSRRRALYWYANAYKWRNVKSTRTGIEIVQHSHFGTYFDGLLQAANGHIIIMAAIRITTALNKCECLVNHIINMKYIYVSIFEYVKIENIKHDDMNNSHSQTIRNRSVTWLACLSNKWFFLDRWIYGWSVRMLCICILI